VIDKYYDTIDEKSRVLEAIKNPNFFSTVELISSAIVDALLAGNKVLVCGNGGSASDANHFVGELIGRFIEDRRALSAISLSTNAASLTCIANDFGYKTIFSRQVEGLGNPGDIMIGITTSGTSENVLTALAVAKEKKLLSIGFTGKYVDQLEPVCDYCLSIPSTVTARIQESHIFLIHTICANIEDALRNEKFI
jgi:D-sedoheptulose 7-phosphate isomerase